MNRFRSFEKPAPGREQIGMTEQEKAASLEKKMEENGIFCHAWLPFADCTVHNERLLRRNFPTDDPKGVLIFLVPYYSGDSPERNVSLYAVPRDYHLFFRELFEELEEEYGGSVKGYSDRSPIDERGAACRAGLGDIGDNGLLISRRYGSYVFIGELFCEFGPEEYPPPHADEGCLHCGACRRSCPSPDACLSDLTQRKGVPTEETIALMRKHHTAWGCDICQKVCPLNLAKEKTPIRYFTENLGWDASKALAAMDMMRAYYWRGIEVIQRNLNILNGQYEIKNEERPVKREAWIYRQK